ncbi:MAG: response regulator [Bacteroidota bacterium]
MTAQLTILLIEDELALQESLKMIIEAYGFISITASNGVEAFNILQNDANKISLILCDINLPDISGYDIIKVVKDDPILHKIPFLFLTAYADEKDVRHGMNLGADDYLTKPISAKDLIITINSRLENRKKIDSFHDNEINNKWIDLLNENFRHEFFNPLNGVLNASIYLDNLSNKIDVKEFKQSVQAIYVSSFRMHRNIRNLIMHSTILAHKKNVTKTPTSKQSVSSILQEVIGHYNNSITGDTAPLYCEIDTIATLQDADLLMIVFTELIDNAIRFNIGNNIPLVQLKASSDHFEFLVTNAISNNTCFDIADVAAFRKFHEDLSLNGLGLGLYISKHLCEVMGYKLTIHIQSGQITIKISNS